MPNEEKAGKTAIVIENRELEARAYMNALVSLGYECEYETDGEKGQSKLLDGNYNLAIIDFLIGEVSGLDIIKKAQEKQKRTFLFCVSRNMLDKDVIEMLEAGGNDYLHKPFDDDVLMAYIRKNEKLYGIGDFIKYRSVFVDKRNRVATCNGMGLDLQPRQFDMLVYLLENKGRIIPYAEIGKGISDEGLSDNAVHQHGFYLRNALLECGDEELIATKRKYGYGIM